MDTDVPGYGKVDLTAQYNPKELQIDKPVPWSKHNYTNKGNDQAKNARGAIALEFTGAEGRSLTVELLFDAYGDPNNAVDVTAEVAKLEALAAVKDPTDDDENKRRPPLCVIRWGEGGMPTFTCVVESLSTKYTMFNDGGEPLRATCTVKLKEADVLSTKDAEHKDPDAGAGAGNSGGGGTTA
ncbi:MAG: hypothetical protein JO257_10090 [Deltaproteobacteria bacterium]|nr:hypothetical protein [Deltaproteobacteria bacterium]